MGTKEIMWLGILDDKNLQKPLQQLHKIYNKNHSKHTSEQSMLFIPQNPKTITKVYLKDVLFPPQENYGAFVTSNDKEYPGWFFEHITKKDLTSKIRLHGHTHPHFSTRPSGTDIHQFTEMMEQVDNYMIQLILSNNGTPHCQLWTKAEDGNILTAKIEIVWQYEESINKILSKVVQKINPKPKQINLFNFMNQEGEH